MILANKLSDPNIIDDKKVTRDEGDVYCESYVLNVAINYITDLGKHIALSTDDDDIVRWSKRWKNAFSVKKLPTLSEFDSELCNFMITKASIRDCFNMPHDNSSNDNGNDNKNARNVSSNVNVNDNSHDEFGNILAENASNDNGNDNKNVSNGSGDRDKEFRLELPRYADIYDKWTRNEYFNAAIAVLYHRAERKLPDASEMIKRISALPAQLNRYVVSLLGEKGLQFDNTDLDNEDFWKNYLVDYANDGMLDFDAEMIFQLKKNLSIEQLQSVVNTYDYEYLLFHKYSADIEQLKNIAFGFNVQNVDDRTSCWDDDRKHAYIGCKYYHILMCFLHAQTRMLLLEPGSVAKYLKVSGKELHNFIEQFNDRPSCMAKVIESVQMYQVFDSYHGVLSKEIRCLLAVPGEKLEEKMRSCDIDKSRDNSNKGARKLSSNDNGNDNSNVEKSRAKGKKRRRDNNGGKNNKGDTGESSSELDDIDIKMNLPSLVDYKPATFSEPSDSITPSTDE